MPPDDDAPSEHEDAQSELTEFNAGESFVTEIEVFPAYESLLTEHYERFLGPTSMVFSDNHADHSNDVKINVHLYPASEDRPFLTAVTCGMGLRKMNVYDQNAELRDSATGTLVRNDEIAEVNEEFSRAELMLYLPSDWDFGGPDGHVPINLLVRLARFPHRGSTWLGPGHTASNGQNFEPYFEGSLLTAAYFLPGLLEGPHFYHIDLTDDTHLHMLWLQPITVAERHVKRLHGAQELNNHLAESEVFVLDIDRPCTVQPENRTQRRARERAQNRRRRARREMPWDQLPCDECHETFFEVLRESDESDDDDD